VLENRKRKITKSKSFSSLDSTLDTDEDSPSKQSTSKIPRPVNKAKCHNHNIVNTVTEAFQQYKSFAPVQQKLPSIANSPDSPKVLNIHNNMNADASLTFITTCAETNISSDQNYSLVTLHSETQSSLPKSHLAIQISPYFIQSNQLNIIPKENRFILELLLLDNDFLGYKNQLSTFCSWAESRGTPILITVPVKYESDLHQHIPQIVLSEIQRPFHHVPCISSTT
jgi:hypothetical protein